MRIYICGYGQIHFTGKCNCWKKAEKPRLRYVLGEQLKQARPGTYHVRVGKQIETGQYELVPVNSSNT